MALKFRISEEKALEALLWIANEWKNITPFYLSKVLFFAEKDHLNKYGRPIIADTYIAMSYGPVPSTVRDYVEGNYLFSDYADAIAASIEVNRTTRYTEIQARRAPRMNVFSDSDIDCLRAAIEKCKHIVFKTLSEWTHLEKAWLNAPANGPMDYEDFIDQDNPHRKEIIEQAREFAQFGVL
jgi:uncharacterized phage-associated protein